MFFRKRIVLHLLFWFTTLLFLGWFYTQLTREYLHTLVLVAIVWPVSICAVYFINMNLIPKYLFRKRYKRFALYSSYTLIVATWITMLFVYLYFYNLLIKTSGQGFPFEIDLAFIISGMFLVIIGGVLGRVIRENFRMIKEKSHLDKQQLEIRTRLKEAELQSLKAQFHPHFLFNTLNNIYSLSLKKSEQTPEMILKLSGLLDYNLHCSDKEKVILEDEIDFLQNYIDLALMRFGSVINLSFEKDIENPQYQISPLILVSFVENAVKHGIGPDRHKNNISIKLTQHGKTLTFEADNNKQNPGSGGEDKNDKSGIGLNQVKALLDLLYSDQHILQIIEDENTFKIKLVINGK